MARRPKTSRWRRLPGAYRFYEKKPADPGRDEERISLFLTAETLDRAAELAVALGRSTQELCAELLTAAIEGERARRRLEDEEARRGTLEGLRAIADDPVYLAEWKAAGRPHRVEPSASEAEGEGESAVEDLPWRFQPVAELPAPDDEREALPMRTSDFPAVAIVLRHAGCGAEDDPAGLLPSLRRGEAIGPASARELLGALERLESQLAGSLKIDRRLAYALHRLAFEGQVLLTDAWPAGSADAATVDVLRLVQEGVDRVLSGEDIRYYPRDEAPESLP